MLFNLRWVVPMITLTGLASQLQNRGCKMDGRRVAGWRRSGQDSAYLILPEAATFWRVRTHSAGVFAGMAI